MIKFVQMGLCKHNDHQEETKIEEEIKSSKDQKDVPKQTKKVICEEKFRRRPEAAQEL